jgi:nucleoside-diphosphate-sugar epimerase
MKILLTGPCGRVGFTTLYRLLQAGHQVRCFDTRNDFISHPQGFNEACEAFLRSAGLDFEWVWGDIRSPLDVAGAMDDSIDAVIHHAAITLPTQCEEEWEYCWDVNYYGTLNVIDAIIKSIHRPKLIYSSSVAVYGFPSPEGSVFVESDPLPSTCTYAATKIASELAVRRSGINFSIMRMASCADCAAPQLLVSGLPENRERFQKERKLKMVSSPAHFVSRDDVNTAYLNALDNPQSDRGIFNVAGPEDCRITFGIADREMAAATGGQPSREEDWGQNPYPQGYYDISHADAVLKFAKTPREKIMEHMTESVQAMGDFLPFLQMPPG